MPRLSEFFGIVVYMYWYDTQKHQMPHFHARYQGNEAVFKLDGSCIEGSIGKRAHRLIEERAKENEKDLKHAWQLAITGKELPWVTLLQ